MIRATTSTHKFTIPFAYEDWVSKLIITYSQMGKTIIDKTEKDITHEGNTITLVLTQEETNRFFAEKTVELQMRVLTTDDRVIASDIYYLPVKDVLNDEVLV